MRLRLSLSYSEWQRFLFGTWWRENPEQKSSLLSEPPPLSFSVRNPLLNQTCSTLEMVFFVSSSHLSYNHSFTTKWVSESASVTYSRKRLYSRSKSCDLTSKFTWDIGFLLISWVYELVYSPFIPPPSHHLVNERNWVKTLESPHNNGYSHTS